MAIKDFKFLSKEKVFSNWMDQMDDYFLGGIEPDRGYRTQVHGFVVGVHNRPLRLEYQGNMDVNSVRSMIHDIVYRYRNYVSINDQTIGFMQNYLNEHLEGRSHLGPSW